MFSGRRLELMPWGLNRFHASGQTAPNGGPNFMYTFNANNQIISGGSVVYDAAGNMIEDEIGNTYTYDDENRMVAIAGSNPVAYTFDAFNRRVELTNTGGYKDLFYDVAGRMSYQAGNEAGFSRVFFGSQQVATINSTGTYYYYGDQVGTLRANTGSSGTVVNTCASLAFGDFQTACTNPGTTNDKADFTGQWNDPYNMAAFPARSYSLGQGRWASTDPAGLAAADPSNPQTWNRYAYVGNNPLSKVDPLGLDDCSPDEPDCRDPCDWDPLMCDPIWGPPGGGGSNPPSPPHNGGGGPSTPQHGPWPGNETTGLPQLPTQPLSLGDLLGLTPGCDFGVCDGLPINDFSSPSPAQDLGFPWVYLISYARFFTIRLGNPFTGKACLDIDVGDHGPGTITIHCWDWSKVRPRLPGT